MDYHSEEVLNSFDEDTQIYPASMTKIMTAIIAFDLLKKKNYHGMITFGVSENAWRLSQSRLFIYVYYD